MNAEQLIDDLDARGVRLWAEDGRIRFRGPRGVIDDDRRELIRRHRDEVLAILGRRDASGTDAADPAAADHAAAHDPFPLTPVQTAYLLGRTDAYPYGGVACSADLDLSWPASTDPARIVDAWIRLVAHHGMLRAEVHPDGSQRVLADPGPVEVPVDDLRGLGDASIGHRIDAVRADLAQGTGRDPGWPRVRAVVTRADDAVRLHLAVDLLVLDHASLQLVLDQLRALVEDPAAALPGSPDGPGFRDQVLARRALTASAAYERDRSYWWRRLDDLPPAPELPLADHDPMAAPVRFRRLSAVLDPASAARLDRAAADAGVTPTSALLAAYAETVGRWSRSPRFVLNVPVSDRRGLPEAAEQVVGDFTSVELLEVDLTEDVPAVERMRALSARLLEDLAHPLCGGTELLAELTRRRGGDARDVALAPVVFTSALAGDAARAPTGDGGRITAAVTRTPQVWIDCQALRVPDGLQLSWDVREGILADGVADAAFGAYIGAVRALADDPAAWQLPCAVDLPADQRERRIRVGETGDPVAPALVHEPLLAAAEAAPDAPAVIAPDRTLTHDELVRRAAAVAARLRSTGMRRGDRVAIVAARGWEQVVAVVGVLLAGGAYVPVDVAQPRIRRDTVLADAGIRQVLTQEALVGAPADWPTGVERIAVDALEPVAARPAPGAGRDGVDPADPAYVIYTSGSTGTPKGAILSHHAAHNTLVDIRERFGVGPDDRVLALAGLGFDLSVFDVLGVLGAGGAMVLPDPRRRDDPSHWAALIARHRVTLWNSVPAQARMLQDYRDAVAATGGSPGGPTAGDAPSTLRLALLSGDWIPVTLPDAMRAGHPELTVVSLGGATEAAIWSVHHVIGEVDRLLPSIPYGTPLRGQRLAVVDHLGRDRPEGVPGEILIRGAGVALGYIGDAERTRERFGVDPATGDREYRTGDIGRYLPDGSIELLGREDAQVKIRGYRIELAEIQAAVLAHPGVADCAVQVAEGTAGRHLVGLVQPERIAPVDAPEDHAPGDAARAALQLAAADVDTDALGAFLAQFDEHALRVIERTLAAAGALVDQASPVTADEVADLLRASDAHRVVVRRWLRALERRGRIARDADGRYRGALSADPERVARAWARVEEAEREIRWSAELLRHVQASSSALADLVSGDLDIAELLYPGAPSDAIGAAYRDNLGVRLLTAALTAAVVALADLHDARGLGADDPLRILEVRGGVGGAADQLIPALAGRAVEYVFTDPSMFHVGEARERHPDRPGVRFQAFDPAADPLPQGQRPSSYDVVICSNGLHGVPDVPAALRRLQGLLAPHGHLAVIESTREDNPPLMIATDFMEVRAGGPADARLADDALLFAADEWRAMLGDLGARGIQQVPADEDPLSGLGQHLLLAQVKADRAPLRAASLRRHTADRLPDYMVPRRWQVLDALPVTANGKVDRAALARLAEDRAPAAAVAAGSDAPRDDVERRLQELWAELLGRPGIGRDDDFFALGGDSLLVARLVGRMREQLPEVVDLEWDVVLRHMLRRPTIAGLAGYVRQAGQGGAGDRDAPATPAVSLLSGSGRGPATVLVHAGIGTIMPYRALMTEIRRRSRGTGSLYGVEVPDLDAFLDADPHGLIDRIAAEYARELLATGIRTFHVVGYCLGGLVATEVARALTEAGADVASFTAISSHSPAFRLDDEMVSEYSFAMMIGIDPVDLGFPADPWRIAAAGARILERTPGVMPADGYASLDGEFADIGRAFLDLSRIPRRARIARMCEVVPPASGSYTPEQMTRFFRTFRQSVFAITRYRPDPYAGDITFLRHSGAYPFPGSREAVTDYWEELALGELDIVDIPGDHYDCLSVEHAPRVLSILTNVTGGAVIA